MVYDIFWTDLWLQKPSEKLILPPPLSPECERKLFNALGVAAEGQIKPEIGYSNGQIVVRRIGDGSLFAMTPDSFGALLQEIRADFRINLKKTVNF